MEYLPTPEAVYNWSTSHPRLVIFHIQIAILMGVVDFFMKLVLKKEPVRRWFYLHAFGNFVVCWYTFPQVVALMKDPVAEIARPVFFEESAWIITVIHLYHLFFFSCPKADWVHHILFVGIGTTTQYMVNYGKLAALYHFFICGLPGGIDYLLMAMVKDKYIAKETRLRWAVELNMWIRSPGITVSWAFALAWYARSIRDWNHFICLLSITFASVFNAQFYARQVTLAAGRQLKMA